MLRAETRVGTPRGIEADKSTSIGHLVDDELVLGLVEDWLAANGGVFVFDGVPRTERQAMLLEGVLGKRDQPLEIAIQLDAHPAVIENRVRNRRICGGCNTTYGLGFNIQSQQTPCTRCGGVLQMRKDDDPRVLDCRLREYNEKTAPLIGYYERKGILARVDASGGPEEVFAELLGVLAR